MNPLSTTEKEVQRFLEIRDTDYTETFYDNGVGWIETFTDGDSGAIDMLVHNRLFWEWWRMNWENRDRAFLAYAESSYALNTNWLAEWKRRHSPKNLGLFPTAALLEESWKETKQQIIETETAKILG